MVVADAAAAGLAARHAGARAGQVDEEVHAVDTFFVRKTEK